MGLITTATFSIYKIQVIDIDKNDHNTLKSTYYNFDNVEQMISKWKELNNEDHYNINLLEQEIYTAHAFS